LRRPPVIGLQIKARETKRAAEAMKEIPDRAGRREARFGPEIKVRMGQQLRVTYSDVMNQGVPDHYSELLRRLDALDQTVGE
jgi:hypothetical protein